jgi:alkyl sulfatase BDS1-like metallo-beta-lactamase superfamily hydrolase
MRLLVSFHVLVACLALLFPTMIGVALGAEAPKDATAATKAANDKLLKELPFDNTQAFKDAHKGFIAPCLMRQSRATPAT